MAVVALYHVREGRQIDERKLDRRVGAKGASLPRRVAEYCIFGLYVQVRVINRDNPGVMQHSLTTLSSIALLRTDDLAHNV